MEKKKILITAHPRSGTKFTHTLLRAIGYNTIFEARNLNGFTVSWKHIFSGTFEKPCPETNIVCDFDKIIHQVRHPLKVISSSVKLWTMSMNYLDKIAFLPDPIVNRDNTLRNCMFSWVAWNKLIETKAVWRYQIEQLYDIQKEWCTQLEIPYRILPQMDKKKNSYNPKYFTWNDLFKVAPEKAQEVVEMAKKYGYTV